eukprot:UN20186
MSTLTPILPPIRICYFITYVTYFSRWLIFIASNSVHKTTAKFSLIPYLGPEDFPPLCNLNVYYMILMVLYNRKV